MYTIINNDKLIIVGAGGHGKAVCDIARLLGKWKTINFLDDNNSTKSELGIDVIGSFNDVRKYLSDHDIIIAIGNNTKREKYFTILEKMGAVMPTIIHPKATLAENVIVGTGSVIMAGVIINTFSKIGKGCILNTASIIGHDNYIEDFVHVATGSTLAGTVHVKKSTWLGLCCVINNNITIARDSVIAAGAVVVRDITETGTYVGVPAKKIK